MTHTVQDRFAQVGIELRRALEDLGECRLGLLGRNAGERLGGVPLEPAALAVHGALGLAVGDALAVQQRIRKCCGGDACRRAKISQRKRRGGPSTWARMTECLHQGLDGALVVNEAQRLGIARADLQQAIAGVDHINVTSKRVDERRDGLAHGGPLLLKATRRIHLAASVGVIDRAGLKPRPVHAATGVVLAFRFPRSVRGFVTTDSASKLLGELVDGPPPAPPRHNAERDPMKPRHAIGRARR